MDGTDQNIFFFISLELPVSEAILKGRNVLYTCKQCLEWTWLESTRMDSFSIITLAFRPKKINH